MLRHGTDRRRSVGTSPQGLRLAALTVASGGVVAYPTEAVYGLGCNPLDATAVHRILAIKRRDLAKGLILIAADFEALLPFVDPLDDQRMAEIRASWPGPNTWLLPARPDVPCWLTGRHKTLAVRVTGHPVAAALCRTCSRLGSLAGSQSRSRAGTHPQSRPISGALVSTSANLSKRTAPRTALGLRLRLAEMPDLIINGACGGDARPSTIRDGRTGRVLRT